MRHYEGASFLHSSRGAGRAAQNDRARRRMKEIEAGLREFLEKKKRSEWGVEKPRENAILDWFAGCHSAGQGGQPLFDNRYDVPESVRPHLGFEHRWDFE